MFKVCNIMLVEDNPGDRQLIQQELKDAGANCCFNIMENGEMAIEYIKKADLEHEDDLPDLIILDINLPKLSGLDVLKQIKKHPKLLRLPVVIFSSSSSPDDINAAYTLHANCYIVKPFKYDEFSVAIKNIWTFWFNTTKLPYF